MNINKRLKTIAGYINKDCNVIDVGCDHALLPIYLVKNNICSQVIGSDINKGPLEQARKNIELYNLADKIKLSLGDGISTIDDDTDTIVISGMGGKTIIDILYNGKDKLKNIKRIILSPNNDFDLLRKALSNIGFKILIEEIVYDKGKYYPIIVLEKGYIKYSRKEILFGYNVVKNENLLNYYNSLISSYNLQLDRIPLQYSFLRKAIKNKIYILKELTK